MEYNKGCKELEDYHDGVAEMECIHGWSDERYDGTVSPWELSGTYRLKCFDGAELIIISRFSDALCFGWFGIMNDSTKVLTDYDDGRDNRVVAYLAKMGAELKRDYPHKIELPSAEVAAEEMKGLGVPNRPLWPYGGQGGERKMEWKREWLRRGLVKWTEDGKSLVMTNPQVERE